MSEPSRGIRIAVATNVLPGCDAARCPYCGFSAGVYLSPREQRTAATPVRCISCRREAVIDEWLTAEMRDEENGGSPRG